MRNTKINPRLAFVDSPDGETPGGAANDNNSQRDGVAQAESDRRPERHLSQADLERIIGERLARDRKERDRDHDRELADLREKAAKYDEAENARKSAEQLQAEALARAEKQAADARADAVRYRAAAEHGITGDYIDLLGGGTDKAVTANAERLGELIKAKAELDGIREAEAARTSVTGRPRPLLRPGAVPVEDSAPRASSLSQADEAAARRGVVVNTQQ